MKDLKIRIWVKPEKKFYYMNIEELLYKTFSKWEMSELEIQMSTGLSDKQGKEIYEGDVVKISFYSQTPAVVDWNFSRLDKLSRAYKEEHREIIGNVWEGVLDTGEHIDK